MNLHEMRENEIKKYKKKQQIEKSEQISRKMNVWNMYENENQFFIIFIFPSSENYFLLFHSKLNKNIN